MAKKFEMTTKQRVANSIVRVMVRTLGVGPNDSHIMSVRGRKSGETRSTPLTVIEWDGRRWLVAPYGEVGWVKNVRAAGRVTLSRGRRSEAVSVVEVNPREGAPVLKEYLKRVSIVRPYFDVTPDSPLEEFEAEARRRPVFRVEKVET